MVSRKVDTTYQYFHCVFALPHLLQQSAKCVQDVFWADIAPHIICP